VNQSLPSQAYRGTRLIEAAQALSLRDQILLDEMFADTFLDSFQSLFQSIHFNWYHTVRFVWIKKNKSSTSRVANINLKFSTSCVQPFVERLHSTNKTPFWRMLYLFWVWNQNGGDTYFGYFSRQVYVQPYHSKGLGESFSLMWLNIGLSWKIREQCVFRLFFKVGLCSAISFNRSRRELSIIDVAENRSMLKNYQMVTKDKTQKVVNSKCNWYLELCNNIPLSKALIGLLHKQTEFVHTG